MKGMAQRGQMGNDAQKDIAGRQSVERGRHCRSFDRGGTIVT